MTTSPTGGECPGGGAGFTVVEVLVALVVLSAGMIGVAGMTASVAEQTRRSAWKTEQALVAQQVVDSIRQAGFASAASGADTLPTGGRQWVASWRVSRPSVGLKRVDVRLERHGGLGARTFGSYLHRPTSLPSGSGGSEQD